MKDKLVKIYLDIETAPGIWPAFRCGDVYLDQDNMLEDTSIFMIQWQVEGENTVHTRDITDFAGWEKRGWRDDRLLSSLAGELLNSADIVIGQNSKRFDEKWIKGRLAKHGWGQVGGYISHDTLLVARKNYYLTSYKLDYLGKFFGFGGKVHTDFSWWKELITSAQDKDWDKFKARIEKFKKYGKRDVVLLRKVYKEMCKTCPEFRNPPTLGSAADGCPQEGCSGKLLKNGTRFIRTAQQVYQRYVCNKCGAQVRGHKGLLTQRDRLV